jgi:hypothetical protein
VSAELRNCSKATRLLSINHVIAIVILIFAVFVGVEVAEVMEDKYSISDSASKVCLMDFQNSGCNPHHLDTKCNELFNCIQKV